MKRNNFFSTKNLEQSVTRRKINTDKESVRCLNIRWLRYYRSEEDKIFYKTTLKTEAPFCILNISEGKAKAFGRRKNQTKREILYKNIRSITKEKKSDMLDLLKYITH